MAKSPSSAPKAAPITKPSAPADAATQAAQARQIEVTNAEEAQRAETAEQAKDAADTQRDEVAAGGSGELDDEARQLAKSHSVSDPKAAPVDYATQTARKPAQRILNAEETSAAAMPRAPIASLPYGSEPRSIDPATGEAPVAKPDPAHAADVHGDDNDPDVDRGSSAALREASNT